MKKSRAAAITKTRQAKRGPKTAVSESSPTTDEAATDVIATTQESSGIDFDVSLVCESEIPLGQIFASDLNPRKFFDPKGIDDLAASLKTHGQIQNIVVRQIDNDSYELIGGERRFRAAQVAGLEILRARVIRCSDAVAIELRGIENYRREQLNAIEEAIWFEQMLGTGRWNQMELAAYLNITQGQVSNRLRLLKLPKCWKERIVAGEIPATQARELAAWADRPTVLAAFEDHVRVRSTPIGDMTVREISEATAGCVVEVTRPIESRGPMKPRFEITDEIREQLDVVTVRHFGREVPRAFNVELWDKLQAEAAKADQTKQAETTADDDEELPASNAAESQSDPRETQSDVSEYALCHYFAHYFSKAVAESLTADATALRLLLTIATNNDFGGDILDTIASLEGQKVDDAWCPSDVEAYGVMQSVNAKTISTVASVALKSLLTSEKTTVRPSVHLLAAVAKDLKIDPLSDFRADTELLEMCSTEQLRTLFTDDMVDPKKVATWQRKTLLSRLVEFWPEGYLPDLLRPEALRESEAADVAH